MSDTNEKKKLSRTKWKLTIFSLIIHCIIAALFVWKTTEAGFNAGLWGMWFGSFNATIGIYVEGKVRKDEIVSQNFVKEMDGR